MSFCSFVLVHDFGDLSLIFSAIPCPLICEVTEYEFSGLAFDPVEWVELEAAFTHRNTLSKMVGFDMSQHQQNQGRIVTAKHGVHF